MVDGSDESFLPDGGRVLNVLRPVREWLGVAVHDWRRYGQALAEPVTAGVSPARGWISLCNRAERLTANLQGPGVLCDWEWGSELHACQVWPGLGRRVMKVALREWPIRFADAVPHASGPRVSFIIAHGGRDRLVQLVRTIRSLFAQTGIDLEVVVVDQTDEPVVSDLPPGIRYRHLAKRGVAQGWHKSWAFNVGAREASGELLVFHDGDVCVPQSYGAEVARTLSQGAWDAASIQRFLFYLTPRDTEAVERTDSLLPSLTPERVWQNWRGGTIAIRRDAFFSIGGFDEGFVDWGGEDTEFYDRCGQALRHCRYGYLPFVHLWHAPQAGRKAVDNPNIARIMPWRMGLAVSERVRELTQRRFGDPAGPDPAESYQSKYVASGGIADLH